MAEIYIKGAVPEEYDPTFFEEELLKIASSLEVLELPYVILLEQNVAPVKVIEGMIIKADGTNWDPGSGQGVYARTGGAWVKL